MSWSKHSRFVYENRTVYPEVPVKVEYKLTEMGNELVKPLYALVSWADDHHTAIRQSRIAYDERVSLLFSRKKTIIP